MRANCSFQSVIRHVTDIGVGERNVVGTARRYDKVILAISHSIELSPVASCADNADATEEGEGRVWHVENEGTYPDQK